MGDWRIALRKTRERRKFSKMVRHSNGVGPEVGDAKDCGRRIAFEDMGDTMTPIFALRARRIVGLTNAHLIILEEMAVPRSELS